MNKEEKIKTIFFRIALIESKISKVDELYLENTKNEYLLEIKNEFNFYINVLKKELEKVLNEDQEYVDIEKIKKEIYVIEKDQFLNAKIQNALNKEIFKMPVANPNINFMV